MRNTLLALAAAIICCPDVCGQSHDWENPEVLGINKLPYHASLQLPSRESECKEIVSLDGKWKFHLSKDPDSRPLTFWKDGYDVSSWDDIVVPVNWQMQGFGIPIYTNSTYPFKMDEPSVTGEPSDAWYSFDHRNPVGSYVTTFSLSGQDLEKNVILHFGGVKSAMYVWVNGHRAGYSQNSMSPAEFDITPYIRQGTNRLAVEVYRWSDGSYLEDQDMWRFSGIFRSVQLWIRPLTHISDYFLRYDLARDLGRVEGNACIQVCNRGKRNQRRMAARLNIDGRSFSAPFSIQRGDTAEVDVPFEIVSPRLWSAEHPELYPYSIELLDGKGNVTEHFDYNAGFKRVEIRGEVLLVNSQPVKLRGVNRHEHHPRTGRNIDKATIDLDIRLMKQCNINFLRTSHYPDSPYLYEACDREGIFVMDEANQESHGYGYSNSRLGEDPRWKMAHVDRALSLAERDKNHASVTIWSLGNEGAAGTNIRAMREAVLSVDTSRPVFYDPDEPNSDLYGKGYPTPEELKKTSEQVTSKPIIMQEYAHAMGNSGGNFEEYWQIAYPDSGIAGGAVWDWVDQGIAASRDGKPLRLEGGLELKPDEYWAYGGDFGDTPNNGDFVINGIVSPDRKPHPHYYETKYVYQPIAFRLDGSGKAVPSSRDPFVRTGDYDYVTETAGENGERLLNIYAHLKDSTTWAPRGFEVARQQFVLAPYSFPGRISAKAGDQAPAAERTEDGIRVSSAHGEILIDGKGALREWTKDGANLLYGPLEPYFWKPENDNQRAAGYTKRLGLWRHEMDGREVRSLDISQKDGVTCVTVKCHLSVGADLDISYAMNAEGRIGVDLDYRPLCDTLPDLPKFGMRMRLPSSLNNIEWYGRGPLENYPDRKLSQFIGCYRMPVSQFETEYVHPQDNGNRCDVRWAEISSGKECVRVDGLQPLCIRAWDYGEEDLVALHPYGIHRGSFVNVNIDGNIEGVGGTNSWGDRTLPQYVLSGNVPRHLSFILSAGK